MTFSSQDNSLIAPTFAFPNKRIDFIERDGKSTNEVICLSKRNKRTKIGQVSQISQSLFMIL